MSKIVTPPSDDKKETPSLFRKKEEKTTEQQTVETAIREDAFDQTALQSVWGAFVENQYANGAGDAEKLVLSRSLEKRKGHEVSILLGSQLEMTILEKFEQDLVQFLRSELANDFVVLTKEVQDQEEKQKLYTSKDKYQYMVEQNPSLKILKDKLGLDFEY